MPDAYSSATSGNSACGMNIIASTNSSTIGGASDDVARMRIASPAGSRNTSPITIHRLPCRCCRSVSRYSVGSAPP